MFYSCTLGRLCGLVNETLWLLMDRSTFGRIRMRVAHYIKVQLLELDRRLLVPLFSAHPRLASLYYFLVSTKFGREHRAVLRGRRRYYESLKDSSNSSFLLRRNIHRLEKGLIMRPRRSVFAVDYIKETVDQYAICMASNAAHEAELQWAHDVLTDYFSSVISDATVDLALEVFNRCVDTAVEYGSRVPYQSEARQALSVDFKAFYDLCRRRRSVRWYDGRPVPRALLEQAVEAAIQAPSACNRQPFRFSIFDNPEDAAKVGSITDGTAGVSQNFPCLGVVVGDLSAYPFERDRHLIYVDASLASMQFMLALETLGLSSCPINWPDIELMERGMSEILGLAHHERPIMLISVGYSDLTGGIPFSQKKMNHDMVRWESL